MVERLLAKEEVASSTLVFRSSFRHNAANPWHGSLLQRPGNVTVVDFFRRSPGDEPKVFRPTHDGFFMAVVGESFCQDHLRRISAGKLNDPHKYLMARLAREPLNEFDANAVCVDVDGAPVGHLRRDNA